MDFLKLLKSTDFISDWTVLANRNWQNGFYYKIRITFKDLSLLQASEYKDHVERSYSFHWQDKDGKLIVRWDNAPHHKEIKTYPHHKHYIDFVEEGVEMTLEEALKQIKEILQY